MKFFKAVFISLFFFAANINPIWAQDEIQIRELLEELRTLKMTVNRQEKRSILIIALDSIIISKDTMTLRRHMSFSWIDIGEEPLTSITKSEKAKSEKA